MSKLPLYISASLIGVLAALAPLPTFAGALDEVLAAHSAGADASALTSIRPLAEQGNAIAEFKLGVMFSRGWALDQDYSQARAWYEKSASQDYAPAEVALGALYFAGRSVPRDWDKAAFWWNKAARQGDLVAKSNLSNLRFLRH